MPNRDININQPIKGLNTDIFPSNLDGTNAYTYALNARQESEDGNQFNLSNEESNTLSLKFKEGFSVIGRKNIPELNRTLYFLTDGVNSEIGYISNDITKCYDNIEVEPDIECNNCDDRISKPILEEPHTSSINSCQEYVTIVSAPCLNFSVNHPIHKVDYKITNKNSEIYWTDNYNPMRLLDLDRIPYFEDSTILDCNAIKIFPDFTIPCITAIDTDDIGSLKAGAYQFFVAYSNSKGEELSEYYSPTNSTSIWENKRTSELGFDTSKSITISIDNLDLRYKFFNLAVGKTINNTTEFELIGKFDIITSSFTYIYTGNDVVARSLTENEIFFKYPHYTKAETVVSQNNILMWGGLLSDETINYQSIASKIVLGWESYQLPYSKFEAYNKGTNSANYRGYLRDEVYAFEFVPILKNGRLGPRTHIPGPSPKPEYFEVIGNTDSANYQKDPCNDDNVSYRWDIYNTATLTGFSPEYIPGDKCYVGPYQHGTFGYYQSIRTYPNNKAIWGDLAGQPIRHHKMPGVDISPIYDIDSTSDINTEHVIYPLGIRVDHLNVLQAIENSDLTQEQKDNIIGFHIVRSTRTNNKSILAKGIAYNVGSYTRDGETFFFPNYSYNDLRRDPYLSSSKPIHHSGANDGSPMTITTEINVTDTDPGVINVSTTIGALTLPDSYNFELPITINGNLYTIKFSGTILHNVGTGPTDDYYYFSGLPYNPSYTLVNLPPISTTASFDQAIFIRVNFSGTDSGDPFTSYVGWLMYLGTNLNTGGLTYVGNFAANLQLDINGQIVNTVGGTNNETVLRYYGTRRIEVPNPQGDIRLNAFGAESKTRFTFHSPDTSFRQPSLNGFFKVENVQYGKAKAFIGKVKDDPKYAIPSTFSMKVAVALGISSVMVMTFNGGSFGSTAVGIELGNLVPTFIQALDMINKLVPLREYGYHYLSYGNYSNYVLPDEGNMIRGLDLVGYIEPGIQAIGDTNPINNFQRESSVYFKTNNPFPFPHEYGAPVDNSRFNFHSYELETGNILKDNERVFRDISSLYGSIKRPYPDQYGDIFTYRSVNTGGCLYLDRNNRSKRLPTIFGGDTFINRFGLKRKLPFYLTNTVGDPNNSDIAYDLVSNVAHTTYWLSTYPPEPKLSQETIDQANTVYKKATDITFGDVLLGIFTGGGANIQPFIKFAMLLGKDIFNSLGVKNTNFDRFNDQYTYEDGVHYLFSYGIPFFFVESDYNLNYRQAENSLERDFFPNVGTDIPETWLQEANVSINHDNYYLYNRDLSKSNVENFYVTLPSDFDPIRDRINNYSTRVIYSETSSMEDLQNNWLVYKANNYFDFPLTNGKLVDLNALEKEQVMVRFENNFSVYNAYVSIETDNKSLIVGTGSMFANPPMEYSNTDIGYGGSQHKSFCSTKYGYFWTDAKRGEIFLLKNGGGLDEITRKGMKNWFKENLPFKILKTHTNVPVDNSYKDIGIAMVWDNRYERLFLTKKDYIPLNKDIVFRDGDFYLNNIKVTTDDSTLFCDASFTIAYSPATESWVSYYSFLPNYYVEQQNYFQSGIKGSLWNHLLTNKSYQTYYNNYYPFEIEAITKTDIQTKTLTSVHYRMDTLRYTNSYDWKLMKDISFNKSIVYDTLTISGLLNLEIKDKKNMLSGLFSSGGNGYTNINLSKRDDIWNFNGFYNITSDLNSKEELFLYNCANSYKEININSVDYTKVNKPFNRTRLKSDWFKVRLTNDKHQRYKMIFKWLETKVLKSI